MGRGMLLALVVIAGAVGAVVACSSFSSERNDGEVGDGGGDATADVTPAIDGSVDAPADVERREAGPLWDGGCVDAVLDATAFCDPFENTVLDTRFDVVVSPENASLSVQPDPKYQPTFAVNNSVLQANNFSSGGEQFAYVKKAFTFGWRFGVAFRFAVYDHPSASAVAGVRFVEADGPEGTVKTLGILLTNRISLQQLGPGGLKEAKDLAPLERQYWHTFVLEVRREPNAPGGLGFVYTTLDGAEPIKTPLQASFTSGTLRVGLTHVKDLAATVYTDDLAFFSEP